MLAEMAPSVAGWPAAKPNSAEASAATAITPSATLSPLRMCWPTNSFSSVGERSQLRMAARAAAGAGVHALMNGHPPLSRGRHASSGLIVATSLK